MVIRFKDTGNLRAAVHDSYRRTFPKDPRSLRKHIFLLHNGDLYIDDRFDSELSSIFLKAMRVHDYLVEDAVVIIPRG